MKKCDLVMKGGVTSGIVYPGAVCELARDFEFVNIGGTSAGAIAASLTAAAEYRRKEGSNAGFEVLSALPRWLAGRSGSRSRLLALFQPHEEAEPLFAAVVAAIETAGPPGAKVVAAVRALLRGFTSFAGMVAAIGATLLAVLLMAAWRAEGALPLLLLACALLVAALVIVGVALGAVAEALVHAWRILPRNQYGLCSGMSAGGEALTQWLDAQIRRVAGTDRPLTFGELARHGIHLEMMTTNLTHGRPYRLPFESRNFYFAASEMRRLFPEPVVEWLIAHAREEKRRQRSGEGEELYPLPDGADMPIVVAARMSLSFPILLSAVPLWSIDFGSRAAHTVAERCWFSDGGITSNFPVHFFDRPLPRWPTFAFNLAEWTPRYHSDEQAVYAPRSNRGGILEWWRPITDVRQFLTAILGTMQNWRDNMLLHLPGQRDRIAHVLLREDEGGLNLAMAEETITRVAAKGAEAGRMLRERFGDAPPPGVTLTWRNHQWVRLTAFIPALESALENLAAGYGPAYDDFLSGAAELPSYKVPDPQRHAMHTATLAFLRSVREDLGARPFRTPVRRPRPEPELRTMARE